MPGIVEPLQHLAVLISDLTPDPANPRVHSDKNLSAIKNSLKRFGQRKPITVRREGMIVTAGNGTLQCARLLGWTHIAAVILDDDSMTAAAWGVSDNRTGELAGWDDDVLTTILGTINDDYPLPDLGFDDADMAALLHGTAPPPDTANVPDPGVADQTVAPQSELGCVYQLGPHRVLCGDATDQGGVARLYGRDKARCIWTDAPYGVDNANKVEFLNQGDGGGRNTQQIAGDCLSPIELRDLVESVVELIPLMDGAAAYFAAPNGRDMQRAIEDGANLAGLLIRWTLVWAKNNHVLGRADYLGKHETILYGWATSGPHLFTGHYRQSVFSVDKPRANKLHPTMKPVELIEPMILNSTNLDEIVADPFLGSGSTLIACARTGRRCFGSELKPAYVDVIRKRWNEWAHAAGVDPGVDAL